MSQLTIKPTNEQIKFIVNQLNKHLSGRIKQIADTEFKDNTPSITCLDGTTLSVQASDYHYCSPRNNHGPWHAVEVWMARNPNFKVEVTEFEYSDDGPSGYVPIEQVALFIYNHGTFILPN